ncbi:oxidative stress defense protein [Photobacterium sp. 1_MG-2023]|uniref:oxidative stress defense protein n=1 Tax=Photobacterium sp. 1_MG-2023 TaxID=3062646 RepID=UPI0026E3F6CE|nr:oxidative stress defense protein [Photobacterium sp. 1_MG-2023]MDO6708043.1 oxidative stress defense protein [Photobacterium sp. 1_MG-2023]
MKKTLLAACFTSVALASPLAMAEDSFPRLETIGVGEVTAQPDMATFSVAVEETRKTAQEAKQAADKAVTAFMDRLQKQGVKRADIESANIYLHPQYHHSKDNSPELMGYQATRQITVTVRDLEQLNTYLDNALGDGINRINNIELKVTDEAKYQEQARQAAIQDAQEKAKSLAKGFQTELDGIWNIRYYDSTPRPVMGRMAMDAAVQTKATYQDAEITFQDRVEVVFRLEK